MGERAREWWRGCWSQRELSSAFSGLVLPCPATVGAGWVRAITGSLGCPAALCGQNAVIGARSSEAKEGWRPFNAIC